MQIQYWESDVRWMQHLLLQNTIRSRIGPPHYSELRCEGVLQYCSTSGPQKTQPRPAGRGSCPVLELMLPSLP